MSAIQLMPDFSLSYLTAPKMHPSEALRIAAATGYKAIGIRILPAAPGGEYFPLIENQHELPGILSTMKETGVSICDLEMIRLNSDFNANQFKSFFEMGAQLKAKHILVAGDDTDPTRLSDSYAQLCEACSPYGLTADLEFMPWTAMKSIKDAYKIIQGANNPKNAGIIIDSLHFARSDSHISDIASIPHELFHYAQICDGSGTKPHTDAELISDARTNRLLPKEGGIDLKNIFSNLSPNIPISIEIPNARQQQMSPTAWAQLCIEATQKFYQDIL
jgi:sugar phosphate isomerase/epimerase